MNSDFETMKMNIDFASMTVDEKSMAINTEPNSGLFSQGLTRGITIYPKRDPGLNRDDFYYFTRFEDFNYMSTYCSNLMNNILNPTVIVLIGSFSHLIRDIIMTSNKYNLSVSLYSISIGDMPDETRGFANKRNEYIQDKINEIQMLTSNGEQMIIYTH